MGMTYKFLYKESPYIVVPIVFELNALGYAFRLVPIYETLEMLGNDDKTVLNMPFLRSLYILFKQLSGKLLIFSSGQEVCKKKVLYIGSNFQAKAFRPPPPLPNYYMQYGIPTISVGNSHFQLSPFGYFK